MRSNAREAALNIIFAQQFNSECSDVFKKKVYRQFGLEKDDDLLFAETSADFVNGVLAGVIKKEAAEVSEP